MNKFCPYCGSKLSNNESFCPYCGEKLKHKNSSNKTNVKNKKIKLTKNSKIAIVSCVILLIFLSISLIFVIPDKQYTISFVSNSDSSCNSIQSSGNEEINLPTPTKTNCYFDGWYTNTGKLINNSSFKDNKLEENLTLYAKWYTYETININISDYYESRKNSGSGPTFYLWRITSTVEESFIPGYYDVIFSLSCNSHKEKLNSGKELYYMSDISISFNLESYGQRLTLNGWGQTGTSTKISNISSFLSAVNLASADIKNVIGTYEILTEVTQ